MLPLPLRPAPDGADVGALAGAERTGAGAERTGAGAGAAGAETTGALTAGVAGVGALAGADASAGWTAGSGLDRTWCELAGCAGRRFTGAAIEAVAVSRSSIAAPAEALEMLEESASRWAPAGRSERPSTKQPANTTTQRTIASAIMRAYSATTPRSASSVRGTRTVFTTDTPSVWSPRD